MKYISTRNKHLVHSFEDAVMSGLSADGGLYVPYEIPQIDSKTISNFKNISYEEIAKIVMKPLVKGSINDNDLEKLIQKSYSNFLHKDIAPLQKLSDNIYVCELFHGPSIAFKDFAMQMLGNIFDYFLSKNGKKINIVGATSGDTGSAAIEAFKNCSNVNVFILHPKGKTSEIQRLQMTTVNSPNVYNIAIDGTFDDCQNIVKSMFSDNEFKERYCLSTVNSINWARIMSQIVYYFYSASRINTSSLSFSVPTGNFGNVLAGYYAMRMGLDIQKLIVASNSNDILTRYLGNKDMSIQNVVETYSPSMDIQISSNFERLFFESSNRDDKKTNSIVSNFVNSGKMEFDENIWNKVREKFSGFSLSNSATIDAIKCWYEKTGIVLDPHTVIGVEAAKNSFENSNNEKEKYICMGTAHPSKFPGCIKKAINIDVEVPKHVKKIFGKKEYFTNLDNDVDKVKLYIKENV